MSHLCLVQLHVLKPPLSHVNMNMHKGTWVHRNWNSKMSERPYIVPSSGFPFSSSLRSITCQLSSSELLFIDWGKLYLSLSKSELAFHSSLMLVMEILKWSEERTNICVSYTLCTALIQVHLKSMY
ncbi:unnamed protein product [Brassica rapa subsp. trilocularis]